MTENDHGGFIETIGEAVVPFRSELTIVEYLSLANLHIRSLHYSIKKIQLLI